MGYFDGLINSAFKKKEDGAILFYPYGKFGSGYILNEEDENNIKKFLKRYYIISLPVIIVTVIFFGYFVLFLLFFELPWYFIKIKKFLYNKNKTEEKITFQEISKNMAFSMGLSTNLLLLLGTVLLNIASVLFFFKIDKTLGIIGILFSGLILIILLYQFTFLIQRNRNKGK